MPTTPRPARPRLPAAVYVLALGTVAVGTSEFMVAGLLPDIAADLAVSVPRAGLLVSAFGLGSAIGGAALPVLTARLPRRTVAGSALVAVALAHVVGALAPDFGVLLGSRVVAAIGVGAFWTVGAVMAVGVAPPALVTRAMALMIGGGTIATLVGVPLGTLLGQQLGWRAPFWAVAAAAMLAAIAVALWVPSMPAAHDRPEGRPARLLRSPRMWLALGTIAVFQSGNMAVVTYLTPLLTGPADLPAGAVPAVFTVLGVGALGGIAAGGALGDRYPARTLLGALGAAAALLIVLALGVGYPVTVVGVLLVYGAATFAAGAPLNAAVYRLAGPDRIFAGVATAIAFNVGNTVGPWLGGAALASHAGAVPQIWTGAALLISAFGLACGSVQVERRRPQGAASASADPASALPWPT